MAVLRPSRRPRVRQLRHGRLLAADEQQRFDFDGAV